MSATIAARQVEETLRLSRAQAERDIARYRLGILAALALLNVGMVLGGLMDTWGVALFYCGCLVLAAGIWLLARRGGSPLGVGLVAVTFDLAVPIWFFNSVPTPPPTSPEQALHDLKWFLYIPQAMLGFFLLVNQLRASRLTAIYGALLATALFAWAAHRHDGFHPAQVVTASFLVLAGVVGISAARRTRKNLELFARLQLLQQYLPERAVERVLGESLDQVLAVGGRRCTVTILSSDLRGFTAMSERLEPEQVVEQLNAFHGAMVEQVRAHGGTVDKFIGDGMLAVFGLHAAGEPASPDAGAGAAVACARGMLAALERLNQARGASALPPLAIGVGVHTGEVVAGNIGAAGNRLEFTVIGDAVNTAARLEGLTKQLGTPVVISETTAARVAVAALRPLPETSIRGRQTPLGLFAPL